MKTLRFVPIAAWLGSGLIVLASSPAMAAELYKCAGSDGVPVYQNMPCEKGKELRNMSNDDTLSVVPMSEEPSRMSPPPVPPAVMPQQPPMSAPPPVRAPSSAKAANPVAAIPSQTPTGNAHAAPPASSGNAAPMQPPSAAPVAAQPPAAAPDATPLGATAVARMSIKVGMTAAEVEAALGQPPMTAGPGNDAPNQPTRWFYLPSDGDSETITTIVFLRGKVTDVERKPMKRDQQ
ncbi:MAG: hypothetical protein FWF41_04060 [Betaproteobacteria bacterium]|nr:hypothetical protein [Betaproteobacteria bacterium]